MWSVGYYGYSWSSTIPAGSTSAHNLNFDYGGIHPNNLYGRAAGFQLRCLQE
ncbi:MAG: hypothetical protein K2K83_02770 [Rikenella sp.]|nr:hypothetical protein [Rikenella sp.]